MIWSKEICEISDNKCILKFTFGKPLKNVRNCDIYVGEKDFLFACNNLVRRFYCPQKFDSQVITDLVINVDSKNQEFSCDLPCYADDECTDGVINCSGKINALQATEDDQNLIKLLRITDSCKLILDGEIVDLETNFTYGFSSKIKDDTSLVENTLEFICKVSNPSKTSPIMRTICREKDELKDFCLDQYKLNFVELQVPSGLENPMKYTFNYNDYKLSSDEQYILDNMKKKRCTVSAENQAEVDCGLISILLAICYDLRTTHGECTCESGWTRNILSSLLTYFEPLQNLKTVLEVFLRRSLIYPMYRNYELSRLCIDDAVEALNKGREWIIKQLMVTYDLFKTSADSRRLLNKYYIEHYLRYVGSIITKDHLRTLSRNLKNVSLDVTKRKLRLKLSEIEADLLKELIEDMHLEGNARRDSDEISNESSESEFESDTDGSDSDSSAVSNQQK